MPRGILHLLAGLAVAVVVVVGLTAVAARLHSLAIANSAFEQRAVAAENLARQTHDSVVVLHAQADSLKRVADRQRATIAARKRQVQATDSLSPPPLACAPNLAARDSVIAAQDREIATLTNRADLAEHVGELEAASIDTLRAALAARPHPTVFVGKTLEVGAALGFDETGRLHLVVGLTVNLGGIKL